MDLRILRFAFIFSKVLYLYYHIHFYSLSDGPTFTSSPVAIVNIDVGQRTDITCEVDSNPISNITWLKDGTTLSNSSDVLISTVVTTLDLFRAVVRSTLRLHVISKNVTGNYSCRAAKDRDEEHRHTVVVVGCKLERFRLWIFETYFGLV